MMLLFHFFLKIILKNFQNLKVIESKKISTKLSESKEFFPKFPSVRGMKKISIEGKTKDTNTERSQYVSV